MTNTTPLWSCLMYHWSIFPSRYRCTVARTSKGRIGIHNFGVALAVQLPIARILVVGTEGTEDAGGSTGAAAWANEAAGPASARTPAKAAKLPSQIKLFMSRFTIAFPSQRLRACRLAANVL